MIITPKQKWYSVLKNNKLGIVSYLYIMEKEYKIYHNLFSEAIAETVLYAGKKGYQVVENMFMWERVPYGETRDFHLDLTKDGKEQKKCLHVQLYRMESGRYELNMYIN